MLLAGSLSAFSLAIGAGAAEPRLVVDAGGQHFSLSEGFPDTNGGYARARLIEQSRQWHLEAVYLDRFDDQGTLIAGAHLREIGPDWLAQAGIATSDGGFFWPRIRLDARLARRWLHARNLVTWLGLTYYDAKDEHEDTALSLESVLYLRDAWVLSAGVQVNVSQPGSVLSPQGFVAVTHGRDGERFLTARYGTGRQAYQPLAAGVAIVDFPFHQGTFTWRQWLGPSWGLNLVIDTYVSDIYDQAGVEFGLFKEF